MSSDVHRQAAAGQGSVPIAIVTVSDTRTLETDMSGKLIRSLAEHAGHTVVDYRIVKDETEEVLQVLDDFTDRTYDVISHKLEKELPGFGEIFRMLSYQEVGAAAMLSRATAGIYRGTVIFSTPGSPNAVQVAMEKLILPEIQHLAWELIR